MSDQAWRQTASGNVYVTGRFADTADLGGGNVTSKGGSDIFVTSFAPRGSHSWQKTLGGTSNDNGLSVAIDSSGNIYLAGTFSGTADLGSSSVTSKGLSDIFVSSFSPGGSHRWQTSLGGARNDSAQGVATDGRNVYLTGAVRDTAALGGGNVTSKGLSDIFVTSFSPAGVHRGQVSLGGRGSDAGQGVATDGSGNVYLTGSFSNTVDLGGGNVTSKGSSDIFLIKLGP